MSARGGVCSDLVQNGFSEWSSQEFRGSCTEEDHEELATGQTDNEKPLRERRVRWLPEGTQGMVSGIRAEDEAEC